MKNASEVGGGKTLLVERSTPELEKMELYQSGTMHEFYSDGVAGLIVNSSVVKVDLFTNEVIYDEQDTGFTNSERRVITHRMVMPLTQFTEFACQFLSQIDFDGIDGQRKNLSSLADNLIKSLLARKNG